MRPGVLVALAAAAATGCTSGVPVDCDDRNWTTPVMTCGRVVSAATAQLNEMPAVTSLAVHPGRYCPPADLACGPLVPTIVSVHATLADGRRVVVEVAAQDDGALRAESPRPVEPAP